MLKWLKKIMGRNKTSLPLCSVVVPAAGNASRMEGIDKIMAPLDGLPVLIQTLRCLERSPLVREIVVVTRRTCWSQSASSAGILCCVRSPK